jgi:hypothetical protein
MRSALASNGSSQSRGGSLRGVMKRSRKRLAINCGATLPSVALTPRTQVI